MTRAQQSRSTIAEASKTSDSTNILQVALGFLEGGQNLFVFPTDQNAQGPAPIISVTAHSWTRRSVSNCSPPPFSRVTKSNSDHSG